MAEVERFWFRSWRAGQRLPELYCTDDDPDGDFDDARRRRPGGRLRHVRGRVRRRPDAAVADLRAGPRLPSRRGNDLSLRWVYLHMIEEYARHNGHADLLRERIDGVTGD